MFFLAKATKTVAVSFSTVYTVFERVQEACGLLKPLDSAYLCFAREQREANKEDNKRNSGVNPREFEAIIGLTLWEGIFYVELVQCFIVLY